VWAPVQVFLHHDHLAGAHRVCRERLSHFPRCGKSPRRNVIQRTDNYDKTGASDCGPMAETMIKAAQGRSVT
ncbi:MAG: hypothetical protein ACREBD_07910, partial [Blastocatellia bacterium]